MKVVEFDTKDEWLLWRSQRIGASDASIISGMSPYKKRSDLLMEKRTGIESDVNQFIVNRGHDFEEEMRPLAETVLDLNLPPVFMESTEYDFMSASLDGFDFEKNIGWECKFCGKDMFEFCEEEQTVPNKYKYQVQQQLFISGAEKIVFWYGTSEDNYGFFDVYPDQELINELVEFNQEFWDDWHNDVRVPNELPELMVQASQIKKELSKLKKKEKELMDKIKSLDFKENYYYQDISYKRSVSYSDSLNMDRVKADFDLKDYYETKETVRYLIK